MRRHTPGSRRGPPTSVTSTPRERVDPAGGVGARRRRLPREQRRHPEADAGAAPHAEDVAHVMDVNFPSPVRMRPRAPPDWLARDSGCVVNVSTLGGRVGIVHEAAYCASKFALCGWSETMAIDLHDTGVEVKLVLPGPIETEIWDQPENDPAAYQGPFVPAAEARGDDRRGDRGRRLRVLRAARLPRRWAAARHRRGQDERPRRVRRRHGVAAGLRPAAREDRPREGTRLRRRLRVHAAGARRRRREPAARRARPRRWRCRRCPTRCCPGPTGSCCARGSRASAAPTPSRCSWTWATTPPTSR